MLKTDPIEGKGPEKVTSGEPWPPYLLPSGQANQIRQKPDSRGEVGQKSLRISSLARVFYGRWFERGSI